MGINISGAEFLNDFDRALINDLVGKTLSRYDKSGSIDVKVKAHNEDGERKKYTVHLVAQTNLGIYNAESFGWQLNVAMKDVLGKLEKQMHKAAEKRKG